MSLAFYTFHFVVFIISYTLMHEAADCILLTVEESI